MIILEFMRLCFLGREGLLHFLEGLFASGDAGQLRIELALRLIMADAQIGYVFRQSREGVDHQSKGNSYGQYGQRRTAE